MQLKKNAILEIITLLVSTMAMLIPAGALYFAVNSFKKQLQLQFFADYTKRYQEITLNFPENINESSFSFDTFDKATRDKTLRYMRAYFDLCSEEYFLWKKGNIDEHTWKEWESGIRFAFSKPSFKQAWKILTLDTIYYGNFTKFVDCAIASHDTQQLIPELIQCHAAPATAQQPT